LPERLGGIDDDTVARMRGAARVAGRRILEDFAFAVESWLALGRLEVWMTPEERAFFESSLARGQAVLEWGSGGSTVEFSRRVSRYVSIENNAEWYEKIRRRTRSDDVYLVEVPYTGGIAAPVDFADYIQFPSRLQCRFDRILIDGRCRVACAREVLEAELLADGGLVFIHDWNRERYREVLEWYVVIGEIRTAEWDRGGIVALRPKEPVRALALP
jgi:hypothetical protein